MNNQDFKDILSALLDAEVEFIVVGAHALAAHGFVRATGELDIWVRPSPENASRVAVAFAAFGGAPLSVFGVTEDELSVAGIGLAIGVEPNRIDLHTAIAGVAFEASKAAAMSAVLFGIPVHVMGHAALVKAKRASMGERPEGSPKAAQDAADLAWLESRGPARKPSMPNQSPNPGPPYTRGNSYRARAESRQRHYRANTLRVAHGKYGHLLAPDAAEAGANFILPESFAAARQRRDEGKGVAPRTFENMLSSQGMCFNVFAPLTTRLDLACEVLRPFIDGLRGVTAIHIEHTPSNEIFGDQSGRGGVDCDLLVECVTDEGPTVQVIETKFVEPEFSRCGFRKSGRASKGQAVCPNDVEVGADRAGCLYQRKKSYRYWQRTDEHDFLSDDAIPARGCPFGDARWQLWVNLALAHSEASRRGASSARFSVCASSKNEALLCGGEILEGFRGLLRRPSSVSLIDLERLLERIREVAPPELADWAEALDARFGRI